MIKNKIQRAFDKAANSYDEHAHAQQHAGMKLTQALTSLQPTATSILDLGCGTGMTTEHLAAQYQHDNFHAIDIAPALLTKARERLRNTHIHLHEMDFDKLTELHSDFDIIYSNMALQWSTDLSALLQNIHASLKKDGCLAFSLPLDGTFRELLPHCALNQFYESDVIANILLQHGYNLLIQETEHTTLHFPHFIHALKSIKHVGANQVHQRHHKGLNIKSHFEKMNSNQLTYVIGYFIARKS